MNNHLPPILFLIFLLVFPAFWYFVIWNISKMSGWQKLAEAFPARTPPSGQKFATSGTVGRAKYNGCLYVFVSHDGLFLSVMFLFSPGHKPLFVPWSAIHNKQVEKLLWREMVKFDIGDPCIATMRLPKKVFDGAMA